MLSAAGGCELSTTTPGKPPGRSSRICYQSSLHATSLSKHVAMCTALVCGVQCSMPARLGHWQSRTSSVCSEMTGQWPDRSAMSGRKTLSPPGPVSYLCGLALRIWTSFWRREDFDDMDTWNAPMVQSRQPLTYRLMESVGLGGPKWHGSSWQRGIVESGSSLLSALMIDVPGDLVWDLPCVQQASYLEGGPLMWMLPLYLHVNQKSDYDDMTQWYLVLVKCLCLYPRHTKYVGVYSFRFSFVRTYIRSSFRHRVKVFALKFIRPHILKTLWWISFILGMKVDIGLKFLSAPSPPGGWPWGQGHGLRIFIKKSGSKFLR